MTEKTKNTDELIQVMQGAILQLQYLVSHNQEQSTDFLVVVKTALLEMVATAIDLVEIHCPGSAPLLYTDMEAAMKIGGIRQITAVLANHQVSHDLGLTIDAIDMTTGMNYIGQRLAITLFKSLNELPEPLRNQDMMFHAIEALLVNLLSQNFTQNAHQVLDVFCEHVHRSLNDLTARAAH